MIDPERIRQLNPRQRQVLRLFDQFEAKEIARQLAISPHTVNEHLRDARRLLGVDRSVEAARALIAYERDNRIGAEPIRVDRQDESNELGGAMASATPTQVVRKSRYHWGVLARLSLIVVIAVGAVALAGALLVGSEAISRIFRAERVDISDPPYRR